MKSLRVGIVVLCFLTSSLAIAGGMWNGNGGDARVCRSAVDGRIISVEFFDWWEHRAARSKGTIDLGPANLSYMDKVRLAIKRLARLSPLRAAMYLEWAESFQSEMGPVSSSDGLERIPDIRSPFPDEMDGCKTEQLAHQIIPTSSMEKRYLIHMGLWDRLDEDGKAGLILHEIIYREAIHTSGHRDSRATRKLNALIATHMVEEMTLEEFLSFLRSNRFTRSDVNGVWITLGACKFMPDDNDRNAYACSDDNFYGSQLKFHPNGNLMSVRNSAILHKYGTYPRTILEGAKENGFRVPGASYLGPCMGVEFLPNGKLRSLCEGGELEFLQVDVERYGAVVVRRAFFDETGGVCGLVIDAGAAIGLLVGDAWLSFSSGQDKTPIMFYPGNRAASGILGSEYRLKTSSGSMDVKAGTRVSFDIEGRLISGN